MSPNVISAASKPRLENRGNLKASSSAAAVALKDLGTKKSALKKQKPSSAASGISPNSTTVVVAVPSMNRNNNSSNNSGNHKRASPFRIKTGCVVALRVGNSTSFQLSWTETKFDSNNAATAAGPPSDTNNGGGTVAFSSNERRCAEHANNNHGEDAMRPQPPLRHRHTRTIDVCAPGYVNVWTSPVAARDGHLALIGKHIRCSFPKQVMRENNVALQRTVLEGEVVRYLGAAAAASSSSSSIIDYGARGTEQTNHSPKAVAEGQMRGEDTDGFHNSNTKSNAPFQIELLVDKKMLEFFPFLTRTDEDVDLSKLKDSARRSHQLEQRIRGANKATVVVTIQQPSLGQENRPTLKWVIQKRVPSKLFSKSMRRKNIAAKNGNGDMNCAHLDDAPKAEASIDKQRGDVADTASSIKKKGKRGLTDGGSSAADPSVKKRRALTGGNNGTASAAIIVTRHLGDGNDPPNQQIANWRWLAGRYHDMLLASADASSIDTMGAEMLSAGFVGEVLKVDSGASPSNTLAMVTLRRLFLPEHTVTGRLQHHGANHIFNDYDSRADDRVIQILIPIEYLVIVGRTLHSEQVGSGAIKADDVVAPYSYSFSKNMYLPNPQEGTTEAHASIVSPEKPTIDLDMRCCHRCRRPRISHQVTECTSDECPLAPPGSTDPIAWCNQCLGALSQPSGGRLQADPSNLPCCRGACDCRSCVSFAGSDLQDELLAAFVVATEIFKKNKDASAKLNSFLLSASILRLTTSVDFSLPHDFVDMNALSVPQARPFTRVKSRTPKKTKRTPAANPGRPPASSGKVPRTRTEKRSDSKSNKDDNGSALMEKEDYSIFKPTCARESAHDSSKKGSFITMNDAFSSTKVEKPRNLRDLEERSTRLITEKKDDNAKASSSSRAARVSQRRLLKDVASFGAANFGLVDTLANREQQLRFDRSGIHAWGVFADAAISAGELIVEYRGELIGNAVAERREIEYEVAKIGSDYMFRIDSLNVCDATKQGNVARFINASCDPNCYTKIITLDGTKRIVIYAKKDINAGDELCYDYKFPLEYDESKRIPCHCGARECRGFMNWDKRYVVLPGTPEQAFSPEQKPLKCVSEE